MRVRYLLCVALPTLVSAIFGPGLHKGVTHRHLQIPPSFSGKGVTLYPAHHPDHNANDFAHLVPGTSRELYYSQEGLRPAMHGSKHGSLNAKFVRPTIVLDHSDHISDVKCSPGAMRISFASLKAFQTAEASWPSEFNVITYHRGCGDEIKGKRSHFLATHPVFDQAALQVTVLVHDIME
ncbi:hypothetical protein N7454_010088 [Penicillium verhagenii]|nr:hypothetical protein N7454_010088 [Penicillium verhagenii]